MAPCLNNDVGCRLAQPPTENLSLEEYWGQNQRQTGELARSLSAPGGSETATLFDESDLASLGGKSETRIDITLRPVCPTLLAARCRQTDRQTDRQTGSFLLSIFAALYPVVCVLLPMTL